MRNIIDGWIRGHAYIDDLFNRTMSNMSMANHYNYGIAWAFRNACLDLWRVAHPEWLSMPEAECNLDYESVLTKWQCGRLVARWTGVDTMDVNDLRERLNQPINNGG